MSESLKKPATIFICYVLTASTLLVFWQVHMFDFVCYDDPIYVYKNLNVSGGLTAQKIRWAFTSGHAANWHPVIWLSPDDPDDPNIVQVFGYNLYLIYGYESGQGDQCYTGVGLPQPGGGVWCRRWHSGRPPGSLRSNGVN